MRSTISEVAAALVRYGAPPERLRLRGPPLFSPPRRPASDARSRFLANERFSAGTALPPMLATSRRRSRVMLAKPRPGRLRLSNLRAAFRPSSVGENPSPPSPIPRERARRRSTRAWKWILSSSVGTYALRRGMSARIASASRRSGQSSSAVNDPSPSTKGPAIAATRPTVGRRHRGFRMRLMRGVVVALATPTSAAADDELSLLGTSILCAIA